MVRKFEYESSHRSSNHTTMHACNAWVYRRAVLLPLMAKQPAALRVMIDQAYAVDEAGDLNRTNDDAQRLEPLIPTTDYKYRMQLPSLGNV